jgi:hypothetical protein
MREEYQEMPNRQAGVQTACQCKKLKSCVRSRDRELGAAALTLPVGEEAKAQSGLRLDRRFDASLTR